jgi:hypothetical protein
MSDERPEAEGNEPKKGAESKSDDGASEEKSASKSEKDTARTTSGPKSTPAEAERSVKPKSGGLPVKWIAAGAAVVVAVVAAVLLSSGKGAEKREIPDLHITAADQSLLIGYARASLEGQKPAPLPPSIAKVCGRHVFIELFKNEEQNFVYAVSDPVLETQFCLPQAIENAVRRLKESKSFQEGWASKVKDSRLALSVTSTRVKPARMVYIAKTEKMKGLEQKRVGWRLHSEDLEIGKTGLYLRTLGEKDVKRLWAPPIQGVVQAHGREDNFVHLREFSKRHFGRVGFKDTDGEAEKPKVKAYTFQTLDILERETGKSADPLNPVRGNVMYGRVDADDIYDTAVRMTDYLVNILDAQGRFDYEYYADSDTSAKSYNIVRHAGTTYSILLTHRYTGDKKYLDAGLRAKDYIIQNLKYQEYKPMPYHGKPGSVPPPFPEPDGSVKLLALVEGERVALGATALSLLAFTEIPKDALDPADAERIRHMVNLTWYLQCESGGFYTDYKEALTTKCPDPQPLYFPGETLLALNALHQKQPDPAYFRLSEKSVGFELKRFRDGTWPDHWVMQALDLLEQNYPEEAKKGDWVKAGHDMAVKYIASQYLYDRDYAPEPPDQELEGGYKVKGGPPRNTPTGSRSEAVAGIYRLLKREKKTAEASVLGDHLLAAAYFLAQEMYRPENTYYLKDPKQAMWGLRGSMIDPTIRIDFNQHALVGIWGAWEVALDRKGIGWPLPEGDLKTELDAKANSGKLVTKWGTRKAID